MSIVRFIPNTLTSLNLVSGCVASTMALQGSLFWAMIWIIIASVFDFSDGLAARLLKAYSPLGKELDSLADVVSFGVAPGMILYMVLGEWTVAAGVKGVLSYLPYLAFIVPAFSGLRLAKFNIDERQTTSFIGLPVPAHALFWASACYSLHALVWTGESWVAVVLIMAFCLTSYLLVSEIPMFSLKAKTLGWQGNEMQYILIICSLIFIACFGFLGISGAILLYIVLSIYRTWR